MSQKREAIVDTALTLFAGHGYHSIGVDRIKDQAGASKMTLYKYFPSKEALIESALHLRDQRMRQGLEQALAAHSGWRQRLRAVFDWHQDWFQSEAFHGCMFIKASEEFPQPQSEIRRLAQQHKTYLRQLLHSILADAGAADAETLSWHLLVVLDGMTVNANMFADPGCVAGCWPMVAELLERHAPPDA